MEWLLIASSYRNRNSVEGRRYIPADKYMTGHPILGRRPNGQVNRSRKRFHQNVGRNKEMAPHPWPSNRKCFLEKAFRLESTTNKDDEVTVRYRTGGLCEIVKRAGCVCIWKWASVGIAPDRMAESTSIATRVLHERITGRRSNSVGLIQSRTSLFPLFVRVCNSSTPFSFGFCFSFFFL